MTNSLVQGIASGIVMHVFSFLVSQFVLRLKSFTTLAVDIIVLSDLGFNAGVCILVQQQNLHSGFYMQL